MEGTPNELNRFLRHEASEESLADIQQVDDAYAVGKNFLEKNINEDTKIFNALYNKTTNNTKKDKNNIIDKQETEKAETSKITKKINFFLTKPAIRLPRFLNGKVPTEEDAKNTF